MKTIGTPDLRTMFDRGEAFALVNTLSPAEFKLTRIPGSENIPLSEKCFTERVTELTGSKNATVVVYSASSECDTARKAAERLQEDGFTDVRHYQGGAKAWKEAGGLLANRLRDPA
jgi:rhodanese-related sulfurtransferase